MEVRAAEEATNEIRIVGHHLFHLFYCFFSEKDRDERIDRLTYYLNLRGYGKEFTSSLNGVLRKIANNPEIRIRLVVESDDWCKKCPPEKRNECPGPNDMDAAIIRAFNCDINGVYALKELIKNGLEFIREGPGGEESARKAELPDWLREKIVFQLCGFLHNWGVYGIDTD